MTQKAADKFSRNGLEFKSILQQLLGNMEKYQVAPISGFPQENNVHEFEGAMH